MKIDKYLLATMNKKDVINIIRNEGPINKAQIAKNTDLSIPTIMKITDELIEKGIIEVVGKGDSHGGKRPELLKFISDSYYIVGIDIGRTLIKVIVMDMSGSIICKNIIPTMETVPAENLITRLIEVLDKTIRESGVDSEWILGIGIGMPGLLDTKNGIITFSPDFHWENIDIVSGIRNRFDLPIFLENSNRVMAMGEYWFGKGKNSSNFICVNLGHGIGAAIVEQGELYRGTCGSSGELGHVTMEKNGPLCECGNYGCLESLASGNAIAQNARQQILRGVKTEIANKVNGDLDEIDAKIVFDVAKEGDVVATQIVWAAIEYIGIGIANYINLLDPDLIILAGGLVNAGDILIEDIKRVIKVRQMRFAGQKVKIETAKLGENATAIGAATIVLKAFIDRGGSLE